MTRRTRCAWRWLCRGGTRDSFVFERRRFDWITRFRRWTSGVRAGQHSRASLFHIWAALISVLVCSGSERTIGRRCSLDATQLTRFNFDYDEYRLWRVPRTPFTAWSRHRRKAQRSKLASDFPRFGIRLGIRRLQKPLFASLLLFSSLSPHSLALQLIHAGSAERWLPLPRITLYVSCLFLR